MRLGFTTCMATHGNGAVTGTTKSITRSRRRRIHRELPLAHCVFCVAAGSTILLLTCVPRTLTTTRHRTVTTKQGFVWCVRWIDSCQSSLCIARCRVCTRNPLRSTLGLCQEDDTVCILCTRGMSGPKPQRSKGDSNRRVKFPSDHF